MLAALVLAVLASRCEVPAAPLPESSGVVASDLQPGVLFSHDDSGDGPRVVALDLRCGIRAQWRLPLPDPVDWEDAARGPGHTLVLADIGDNTRSRRRVQLVRVPEPRVGSAYEPRPLVQPLRYPDGPHDAEALLVHPGTGAAWIITKSAAGEAGVYAAAGDRLRRVATLHLGLGEAVTGAAARPDGRALVVRTYTDAWEWTVPAGSVDLGGALRAAPARHLAIPLAPQGEGVTYLPDGRSLALTSEAVGRNSWPLDVLPLDPAGPSASASEGSAAPPAAPPTSTSAAPGRVVRNAGPGADRTPVWLGLGAATVTAAAGLAGWRVRRARRR